MTRLLPTADQVTQKCRHRTHSLSCSLKVDPNSQAKWVSRTHSLSCSLKVDPNSQAEWVSLGTLQMDCDNTRVLMRIHCDIL